MTVLPRIQHLVLFLLAIALSGCAGPYGGGPGYDPLRCDRNGDETQRRAC